VTVEFGGSSTESILILSLQAKTLAGAMMVVDHKGRIAYATTQLGAMLGYTAKQLAAMDLQSVVPPPYSQMHAGFMKVWVRVRVGGGWLLVEGRGLGFAVTD